jgi:DNA replication protein DnaC
VEKHHSVVIVGATGLGKSYISCALADSAIRHGYSALYLRGPRVHDEIALARADGRLPRLMAAWARIDVLAIDDFLLRPLLPDQAADLLEVIEDRVELRSTIVTSQLPVAMWHEALGEPTIADGILDRLLENVHRIELRGESLRRGKSGPENDASSGVAQNRRRGTS